MVDRPSVFVLLAEDQLQSSLRGAVRFVIKFLMGRYPRQLASLQPHSAELQLLLELAIQWSYLHRWNGTFTERFFSLQRFSLVNSPNSQNPPAFKVSPLSSKDILLSLVAASLVPYLLAKLDRRLEVAKDRQQTNERFGQALYQLSAGERLLLLSGHYTAAKQLAQLLKVLLWISYSVKFDHQNNNSHSSLPLYLLGLLGGCHLQLGTSNEAFLQEDHHSSRIAVCSRLLSLKLTTFFDVALKSGAFLVQFLEYWYAQADVRQMLSTVSGPLIPPPPSRPPKNLSIAPDLCPLCLQSRTNQTALATSGYVFCYVCIHDFVKVNRQCPVTGFPCTLDQLIRLFD